MIGIRMSRLFEKLASSNQTTGSIINEDGAACLAPRTTKYKPYIMALSCLIKKRLTDNKHVSFVFPLLSLLLSY